MTWQDIPGWFNFEDIYDEAVARAQPGSVFVEVGCWFGKSTAYLANAIKESGKQIFFNCVDTWEGEKGCYIHEEVVQQHGGSIFAKFNENMQACGVRGYLMAWISDSAEAAKWFGDGTVDFVFIDAAHDYDSVRRDLLAWLPKLKPTGHIAGHDYEHPPVKRAVDELITARARGASWERIPTPSTP